MMQQKSISQRRGPATKVTGATIPRSDLMMRDGRDVRSEIGGTAEGATGAWCDPRA